MKLSTKGRYGIRAMVDLAFNYGGEPTNIKSIAERQGISELYLEQLFASLRKAKLVKSIRGALGGYILSREPSDITIYDIMQVLEGPVEIAECLGDENICSNTDCCTTRLLWARIKDSIDDVLKSTTLKDMVDDSKNIKCTQRRDDKNE